MSIKHITKKIKLGKIKRRRRAPRWVDIKKFGMKGQEREVYSQKELRDGEGQK